jgi:hypothetical protein
MKYIVYQIKNKVNGKLYIGVHRTPSIEDGYMGSGKYLKRAIKKYGIENFEKTYLAIFDNPDDMYTMESHLVNEEFVGREDTYNLKTGGEGGPVVMKNTEYYSSGDQKKSAANACVAATIVNKQRRLGKITEYNKNPNICANCNNALVYDKRKNKFCSSSCSAKVGNLGRVVSESHRKKTSETFKKKA